MSDPHQNHGPTKSSSRTYPALKSNRAKPPQVAPNVMVILTDDVGFASSSTFGGPIPTPTFDALAKDGLRYNAFHTTAMCSSTRAALLTGRNHHTVGTGTIVDFALDEPGYNSIIPPSAATIARVLRQNGYSTCFLGKNHNTPDWEVTAQGPFDRWPTGLGFDYFYGFHGGATDQNAPSLVENTTLVDTPTDPNYFLDRDLADHAIDWLKTQQSLSPSHPFLLYLAPGTAHSPHRAPDDWIGRFTGQFDRGWDNVREETFLRQKKLGIIPPDAALTPRPKEIPAWDSLSNDEKRIAARMMEVFAGQLAFFEEQLGRVIVELKRQGRYDNTLIIYIQGDNGASAEGEVAGTLSDTHNGTEFELSFILSQLDFMGGPATYQNYPVGWAWAMDTPFQWTKQVASHFGGTRNGMVICWPNRIKDKGGIRTGFGHVVDIAPTIYEAAAIQPPATVAGVEQIPLEGVSLAYSFNDQEAPSPHTRQYFEMVGNRAWYEDGWIASTTPGRIPWIRGPAPPPGEYKWELYDLSNDYSQAHDVAAIHPKKLADMRAKFENHAAQHSINPIDNQIMQRTVRNLRPYVTHGRTSFAYHRSEIRVTDQSFPDIKNLSWSLGASITFDSSTAGGTIICQGGYFGGWGLFVRQGRPEFVYRATLDPADLTTVAWPNALSLGRHRIHVELVAGDPSPGAGIDVRLSVDDEPEVIGRVPKTVPMLFIDEGIGIGRNFGTGLKDVRAVPDRFTGSIDAVLVTLRENIGHR